MTASIAPVAIEQQLRPSFSQYLQFVLGVILPILVLLIELSIHVCREILFDPIPTPVHAVFVAIVPVANLLCWFWLQHGGGSLTGTFAILNGLALGISLMYAFSFLHVVPIALLASFTGLGLLPLTPYGALWAAFAMRSPIERDWAKRRWIAALVPVVMLSIYHSGEWWTRDAFQKATSSDPKTRAEGLRRLRLFNAENGFRPAGGPFLTRESVTEASMEKVRYQLQNEPTEESVAVDRFTGTNRIGPRIEGLSLTASEINSTPHDDYVELDWQMVFENASPGLREARVEVQLPAGAVVSRVTLWVKGEPREAAFAGKGKVEAAYRSVVVQRRDPLLVTSAGPGRVFVQCFPILQNEPMRIRLGITAPYSPDLRPVITAANFRTPVKPPAVQSWPTQMVTQQLDPPINVIVDGSYGTKPYWKRIQRLLAAQPNLRVIFAGDVPIVVPHPFTNLPDDAFEGRKDNAAALAMATGPTVWIHNPQDIALHHSLESLRLSHERRPDVLISFPLTQGHNVVLATLDATPNLHAATRLRTLEEDLGEALHGRIAVPPASDNTKLLTLAKILELIRNGMNSQAVRMAAEERIVTPVSGAVVLETRQQFEDAGLKDPSAPKDLSATPEPGTLVLVAIGIAAIIVRARYHPSRDRKTVS